MKTIVPILLLVILSSCNSPVREKIDCEKYTSDYIPIDLYDALDYLECTWSEEDKTKFKDLDEEYAGIEMHFRLGLGIRNSWGLWSSENSLVKFFNSHGIFHPDDISSIIITSFHRRLNNKDIDFESQVQHYIEYWKPIEEFEKKAKETVFENYNNYNFGDSISIFLKVVSTQFNGIIATYSIGPDSEWTFDTNKDLKINAVLLDKKIIKDSTNVAFLIKINELNRDKKAKTCWGEIQVEDTIEIEIKYLIFE